MNIIFDMCVAILEWLAALFGVSYVTINVVVFCILWPAITLGLIVLSWWLWRRLKSESTISERLHDALLNSNNKLNQYIQFATVVENLPDNHQIVQKRKDDPHIFWQVETRGGRTAGLTDVGYTVHVDGRWIKCHGCNMQSYHPKDVQYRYCGKCEAFHVLKPDDVIQEPLTPNPA